MCLIETNVELVENVWDPLSNQQTHRLVKLIRKLVEMYPSVSADSKNTVVCVIH